MTTILDYIVSVNICLLVFFIFYYLFLAREKFFKLNRFFLLVAVLVSFIIPSIDIEIQKDEILETQIISKPILLAEKFIPEEVLKEKISNHSVVTLAKSTKPKEITTTVKQQELENTTLDSKEITATILSTDEALSQEENTHSSWEVELWQVLLGVYILGAILLIIRTLKDVYFLLKTGLTNENTIQNGYRLVNTEGRLPTLSFFRFLFWDNSVKLNKTQKEQIIQHELAHIKQWHTIDVLFMELLCILFWYNPIVYLFRRSIKEVHEYLADAAVLQSTCPNTYAKLLVSQVLGSPQLLLSNHFMQAQIKKRITMMTQTNSRHSILWKYLLVIPIVAGMIISFARLAEVPSDETRTMQASLLSGELNSFENAFLFFNKPSTEEKNKKEEAKKEEALIALENEIINAKEEGNITLDLRNVTLSNQEAMLFYTQNNAYIEQLTKSKLNNFRVFYDSTDTKKEKRTIVWVKKGKKYELNFNGDEIEKLEIDGKEIPKEDYDKHINIIDKAKNNNFVFISDGDDEDIDINIDFDGNFEGLAELEELKELKKLGKMKVMSFDCEDDCKHDDKNCDKLKITVNGKTMIFSEDDKEKWEAFGEEMEDWGEKFGEELAANLEESFNFVWIDEDDKGGKKHKKHKQHKKHKTVRVNGTNSSKNNIRLKVVQEIEEEQKELEKERENLREEREEQREEFEKQRDEQRKELEKQREELQKQRAELQKQREELQKQREELKKEKKNDN
jgi:hypothetical protein